MEFIVKNIRYKKLKQPIDNKIKIYYNIDIERR
nr:MAG TPA: hypothetical protein [Caudoviricetes sp.]